eukprot:scaffold1302_cov113-Skeletonema_marinoi.AAC.6
MGWRVSHACQLCREQVVVIGAKLVDISLLVSTMDRFGVIIDTRKPRNQYGHTTTTTTTSRGAIKMLVIDRQRLAASR